MLRDAYERARQLMEGERDLLGAIAKALLSKRALTHREIVAIEAFHDQDACEKALIAVLGRSPPLEQTRAIPGRHLNHTIARRLKGMWSYIFE